MKSNDACPRFPKDCSGGRDGVARALLAAELNALPESLRSPAILKCRYCGCVYEPGSSVRGPNIRGTLRDDGIGLVFKPWAPL
jgi:hypothetical protein